MYAPIHTCREGDEQKQSGTGKNCEHWPCCLQQRAHNCGAERQSADGEQANTAGDAPEQRVGNDGCAIAQLRHVKNDLYEAENSGMLSVAIARPISQTIITRLRFQ